MSDFEYARDKVLMGPKREEVLSRQGEADDRLPRAGHALLAWLMPGCDRVHKVTIIPRGRALGVTQLVPEEDRVQHQRARAAGPAGDAAGRPGGREADLRRVQRRRRERPEAGHAARPADGHALGHERAARARSPITRARTIRSWAARSPSTSGNSASTRPRSSTRRSKRFCTRPKTSPSGTLQQHAGKLTTLADALLEREVIDDSEIAELIGPSVNESRERSAASGRRSGIRARVAPPSHVAAFLRDANSDVSLSLDMILSRRDWARFDDFVLCGAQSF